MVLCLYDIEYCRKADESQGDTGTLTPDAKKRSIGYVFPVESSINTTIRTGYHFVNKGDFSEDTEAPLNEINLNKCVWTKSINFNRRAL